MDIFFFFQSPVKMDVMQENRKKTYYNSSENKGETGCCTYNVGTAKCVSKLIGSKFDKVIYAYDEFDGFEEVNNEVESDLTGDNSVVTKNNIITVKTMREWNSEEMLSEICQKAGDVFKENSNVYIATNGGNRNNMMFFLTFVEIMSCRKVNTRLFYAERKGANEEIVEISSNVNYYGLLRGVELFTETGNPSKLIDFYKDYDNKDLDELFIKMDEFYNSIQICRRVNERGLLDLYKDLLCKIDDINDKYIQNKEPKEEDIPDVFKLLIPCIKSSFAKKNKPGQELIQIIQWCYDNNNIALGYFIFKVEVLKFFLDSQILKISFPDRNTIETLANSCKYTLRANEYKVEDSDYSKLEVIAKICSCILTPDGSMADSSYSVKSKNIDNLKKLGFITQDYVKTKKIILIYTLLRKVRNSIAHSDDYDIVSGNKCITDIISCYEEKYFKEYKTDLYTNKSGANYTLEADDKCYFFKIRRMLKYMLDDIKSII